MTDPSPKPKQRIKPHPSAPSPELVQSFRNDPYRSYMRQYMRAYRARKRAEGTKGKGEDGAALCPTEESNKIT